MERIACRALTGLAWFQALSTVAGWVTLWGFPRVRPEGAASATDGNTPST